MTERINPIQMLTWNHLNVNEAGKEFKLAVVPEGGFGKADITITKEAGASAAVTYGEIPSVCGQTISGVGELFDEYVKKNANCVYSLVADGDDGMVREDLRLTKDAQAAVVLCGIHAKAGSKVSLMQVLRSDEDVEGLAASLTQIYAEKGSEVRLIQVSLAGDKSRRWNGLAIDEEADAHVDVIRVELGAETSAVGSRSRLTGDNSDYSIHTVYFVDGKRFADFNDTAEFYGKETHSEIHATGVLAASAHKVLRETVDFKRGSVHAVGHEGEDVVMFGDEVVNKTTPLILCGEEWVEGQHAATTTQLDERMLYYLESRGLSPAEAKRIMIDAKICPVTDLIPDESIRDEIAANVGRRLDLIDEFNV